MTTECRDPIRVLVVDDHPVVREGLVALLGREPDMVVVAQADDREAAVAAYRGQRPDVVTLDLRLRNSSGLEALAEIRAEFPGARVLVLTCFDGDEDIYRALEAGARGYLLKDAGREELVAAVRAVAAGARSIPPAVAGRLARRIQGNELTARELTVLRRIVAGGGNKQIASALGVTVGTVKTHVNNILGKLGVADRTAAAVQSIRRGIVWPPEGPLAS